MTAFREISDDPPRPGDDHRSPVAASRLGEPSGDACPVTPTGLLDILTRERPQARLLRDGAGVASLIGRTARDMTRSEVGEAAVALARRLRRLDLPESAAVAICLPTGTDCCIAALGVAQAGLTACFLPVSMSEERLGAALDLADARALLTQTTIGDLRPAELFCRLAARRFRMRFVLAFGPDVPDGVEDLDVVLAAAPAQAAIPTGGDEDVITCEASGGPLRLVRRRFAELVAFATPVLWTMRVRNGDLIVTCLAQDDVKALSTGLFACLASGAALECHLVFDPVAMREAVAREPRTHLVLPGWLEAVATALEVTRHAASVTFVHGALDDLDAKRSPPVGRVVDVVALGERAIFSGARRPDGRSGIRLDERERAFAAAWRAVDP